LQVDLLLRAGLLALRRMGVPRYRTKFSKKTFTQHQQLLALALKELKKTSYRGLRDELADSKAVDRHLHLPKTPHFTTPQKFLKRTQPKWLNLLLKRLAQLVTHELYAALDATCWRERAANTHYLNRTGKRIEVRDTWKSSDLFDVPTGLFVTTRGKAGTRMERHDLLPLVDEAEHVVEVYADAEYDTHQNWNGLKRRRIRPYINHKLGRSTPGQGIRGERKAAFLRRQRDPQTWKDHYRHRTRIEGAYHAMKALLGDHLPGHTRWMRERYRLTKYWAYDLQRVARRHAQTLGLRGRRQGCLLNPVDADLI
jgi:Transposase DDE domain